ncbi:MAG TPA: hypothetical protein VG458_10910 [Solirubrobacterales bacterium]|nr:hypothetical protein [Solirubrobacterales bacterium]
METMREAWTDDRLDDLRDEMRRGFDRMDADVRDLRSEVNALQRTMVIGFAAIGGGVLASVAATVLAAVLG